MKPSAIQDKQAQQSWQEILAALQAMIGEASYNTWFTNAVLEQIAGSRLVIGAANRFVRVWLEKNYLNTIADVAAGVLGFRPEVEVVISRTQYRQQHAAAAAGTDGASGARATTASGNNPPVAEATAARSPAHAQAASPYGAAQPLFQRSNHTFENFVEGRCNRFALAAAKQAAECPGVISPLIFFGGHGLGKTHLLHAICRAASQADPTRRISCVSADYFVQSFSAAYVEKRLPEFRARHERCQLLCIDDLQALCAGKKTATQRELVAILEHFAHHGKQVVIATDRPLPDLEGLDPMLASRLAGGVQAKLEGLDETTRLSVVRRLAPELTPEVSELIAGRSAGGVRELEGVVKTVGAMARLAGEMMDASRVEELLAPARERDLRPEPETILAAVSGVFQIAAADLRGKKRQATVSTARRVYIRLCRELAGCSLSEIGKQLGGRSHTTILNILKTASGSDSPLLFEKVDAVLQRLSSTRSARELFAAQSELFDPAK